jgi:hypothetical protein
VSNHGVMDRTEGGHRVFIERSGKSVIVHWGCESRTFEATPLKETIEDVELLARYEAILTDRTRGMRLFSALIKEGDLYVSNASGLVLDSEHVPWDDFKAALMSALRARS